MFLRIFGKRALIGATYKETNHDEQLPKEGHQTVQYAISSYVSSPKLMINVTALTHKNRTKNYHMLRMV